MVPGHFINGRCASGLLHQAQPGATYVVNPSEAITVKALTILDDNVLNLSALTLSVDTLDIGRLLSTGNQISPPIRCKRAEGTQRYAGSSAVEGDDALSP